MRPLATVGAHDAPDRDAIDLEALLGDSNAQLVCEGLYRLRELKVEALRIVRADGLSANGYRFTPWDFGIPQIDRLLARFGAEPVEDPAPTEEPYMSSMSFQFLPLWAKVAIEWLRARPEIRSEAKLDELPEHFAQSSATVVDDDTRQSARAICRRRFMTSYSEPPVREDVPPGTLQLAQVFHNDGVLHPGDRVVTARLGNCEVARVHGPQAIEVCEMTTGRHYLLSGSDFGPEVQAGADAATSGQPAQR